MAGVRAGMGKWWGQRGSQDAPCQNHLGGIAGYGVGTGGMGVPWACHTHRTAGAGVDLGASRVYHTQTAFVGQLQLGQVQAGEKCQGMPLQGHFGGTAGVSSDWGCSQSMLHQYHLSRMAGLSAGEGGPRACHMGTVLAGLLELGRAQTAKGTLGQPWEAGNSNWTVLLPPLLRLKRNVKMALVHTSSPIERVPAVLYLFDRCSKISKWIFFTYSQGAL